MLHMRSLPDKYTGTQACNDADSRPTLRAGGHGISLPAPLHAQAGTAVQNRLSSCLASHLVGPVYGYAMEVLAHRKTLMGNRPFTIRPSPKSLLDGPMVGRSGRPLSPAWRILPRRNTST